MNRNTKIESIISREQSTAIKGFLMLLIVLGHCYFLTRNAETGEKFLYRDFLYLFHVSCFFILPWLYGSGRSIIGGGRNLVSNTLKDIVRLGRPYFVFFAVFAIIQWILNRSSFDISTIALTVKAFIFGDINSIKNSTNCSFLWFLPAMISCNLFRNLWYISSTGWRIMIIALSLAIWSAIILRCIDQYDLYTYVPFAIIQGLQFIIFCAISDTLLRNFGNNKWLYLIALIVFINIVLVYFCQWRDHLIDIYQLLALIMPVIAMLLIYKAKAYLAKSRLLSIVGQYSLYIYLTHVIVLNLLNQILLRLIGNPIILGCTVYFTTLVITLTISIYLSRNRLIQKYVFPK